MDDVIGNQRLHHQQKRVAKEKKEEKGKGSYHTKKFLDGGNGL